MIDMLLVKTQVGESTVPGAGKGLFADQFILKGTAVWRVDRSSDKILEDDEVSKYPDEQKQAFVLHAFRSTITGKWIACFDGAQYMNHSDVPNLGQKLVDGEVEFVDVALRDIHKGEELYDDYYGYDLDAKRKLKS